MNFDVLFMFFFFYKKGRIETRVRDMNVFRDMEVWNYIGFKSSG